MERLAFWAEVFIAVVALGCTGGNHTVVTKTTKFLYVADSSNNRVLQYGVPFSTNENATLVLGQAGFTTGAINQGGAAGAGTMSGPSATAVDSAGNLYVADSGNCRVLKFATPFSNGMSATLVLGQSNFTGTCVPGVAATAASLGSLGGLAFDSSGNLWVADSGNSRVLEYTTPFSNGMAAALAIGQASPNASTGCNQGGGSGTPSASTLCSPNFIVFDSTGNLWVADGVNTRVLKYSPPFASGMAASVVIGQPNFTSNSSSVCTPSATETCSAVGVAFDHTGNLWVGDDANCRVLEFTAPFSTNMAASLELGQPAGAGQFTESCTVATTTQSALFDADGLAFDSSGNLFVADLGNSRTMVFSPPFSSGMNAAMVIGQANFTSGAANQGFAAPTAATQNLPFGVATSF
jgi:sugar lactone lactonase YvrE